MKKKGNLWKWFSGLVITAGLTVFASMPPHVAGPVGDAVNDQAWSYFEDEPEGAQAPENGLDSDQEQEPTPSQESQADSQEENRGDRLKDAAGHFLLDEVTRQLDKSN